ncbi:unnamed protein product, partial [Urochloa humidicola]
PPLASFPALRPSRRYSTSAPLSPPLAPHWRCEEQRRGEVLRRRMANNTAVGADASSGRAAPASAALANPTPAVRGLRGSSSDGWGHGGSGERGLDGRGFGGSSSCRRGDGGSGGRGRQTSSRMVNCQMCSQRVRIALNLKATGFRVLCCTRKKLHEWK